MSEATTIRPAEPADTHAIATVQVATWRTTYAGIVAQESIDRLTVADREVAIGRALRREIEFPPEAFVATRSGHVLGYISGGASREPVEGFDAELYAIYLLEAEQRVGLGRALVRRLAARLDELGYRAMMVRVLTGNPACRFYERLGVELIAEGFHTLDQIPYPERVYGYRELSRLADSGGG